MGKILWLASYPKSGNTWLRAFLDSYAAADGRGVSINDLEIPIVSQRYYFDDLFGVESANLSEEEIEQFRSDAFHLVTQQTAVDLVLKTHDAFGFALDGAPFFSPDFSRGAIYLLRNPLDVAVSYAAFNGQPVSKTIAMMAAQDQAVAERADRLYPQVRQKLGSWSLHVASWVDQQLIPVHIVRYEDMLYQPLETFRGVLRFTYSEVDERRMERAIGATSFTELQKQELAAGFRERPPTSVAFFRKGRAGSWREVLSDAQRDQIVSDQREVMQRFGYLTQTGEIVY